MAKFSDPKRGLRKPDYYIMASNVRLSANAINAAGKGEGGIDKVTAYLASKASKLGIKEVLLWHYDTLSSLFDTHQEVRTTFNFWVQPGDVLAALLRKLEGPSHVEILDKYLKESLRQAREIKTKDVGQTIGRAVALEEVFIDLPIRKLNLTSDSDDVQNPTEGINDDGGDIIFWDDQWFEHLQSGKIIAELMSRSADRFGPECIAEQNAPPSRRESTSNRIVLLGGPGQGKSTVGQFLAQFCRARLLSALPGRYSPETYSAICAVLARAKKEQIPNEGPFRYPFHIELPAYADALSAATSGNRSLSILAHLAKQIERDTEVKVEVDQLERWLSEIPSIVILDGLDEVPASGNRADVIRSIEQLLDVLHGVAADCLIFATSRPQGYQDELSPNYWAHWQLEPLRSEEALELARNVAAVLVSDDVRRTDIVSKLADAAKEPTTAPLLTSPLQVMLLFQLVATHNNVPKDRWTLFNRHYETLRDREISKGGATGTTIGVFKQQIDSVHADVGYLLQLRTESAGGASPYLTMDEFRSLVRRKLETDGFEEPRIPALIEQIASVATDRLVFLRSQVAGQVAFDVRSLQEFMAAVRLTTGSEAVIIRRLMEIAGRSNWSHVLRIAASKILGSAHHEGIRDGLVAMLDSIDAGDRAEDDRTLKVGSRIALQLLSDGAGANVPALKRKLMIRALGVIELPDQKLAWSLARELDFAQTTLLEPRLTEAIHSSRMSVRAWGYRLLVLACNSDSEKIWPWTKRLLIKQWPTKAMEVLNLFDQPAMMSNDPEFHTYLRDAQLAMSPNVALRWLRTAVVEDEAEEISLPPDAVVTTSPTSPQIIPLLHRTGVRMGVSFTYLGVGSAGRVTQITPEALPAWRIAKAAGFFSEAPTPEAAAAFLDEVSSCGAAGEARTLQLPWLLRALIENGESEQVLTERRQDLLNGKFGGVVDWLASEARWEQGIDVDAIILRETAPPGSARRVLSLPSFVGRRMEGEVLRRIDGQDDFLALVKALPESVWAIQAFTQYVARRRPEISIPTLQYFSDLDAEAAATSSASAYLLIDGLIEVAHISNSPEIVNKAVSVIRKYLGAINPTSIELHKYADILARFPEARDIIPLMISPARYYFRSQRKNKETLPPAMFEILQEDTPSIRASVMALRIMTGMATSQDARIVETLFSWEGINLFPLLDPLVRGQLPGADQALAPVIARAMISQGRASYVTRAYSILEDLSEAAPVQFHSPEKAEALLLPPALPVKPLPVKFE